MRFSEAWLREWVSPAISTDDLVEQLTMAGLEVDSAEPAAESFSGVVVGEVLAVSPHPDAEKLRVCCVDTGGEAQLTIVCGAPNVWVGMRVPTALVGARLPGGMKIRKAKLRGMQSEGMLCSASELGLAEKSEGIMSLPDGLASGTDVRTALDLDDVCIDVDLTPNRGDCLGLAGIAREVGVLNRCPVHVPNIPAVEPTVDDRFLVVGEAPTDCPRYLGRVIRGVRPQAETPSWMCEKLRRSGVRSLGAVVDVTNYVLLELGQPMHAFDLSALRGGIIVRRGREGERLTLLDGQQIEVGGDTLVIADEERPVALAGIMGGADSAVSDSTTELMLECAYFSPLVIAGRARGYGLHTDASHRYERGVDPQLQQRAMQRATALLLEIVGGEAGPVVEYVDHGALPQRSSVPLRSARIRRLLGVELPSAEVVDILQRLGMEVTSTDEGWQVQPPSYRGDITIEADLVEELGRIYGYARIPTSPLHGAMEVRGRPESAFDLVRAGRFLVARDYQEAVTYSFVDPAIQSLIYPDAAAIPLSNPISSELSVMRTGTWPGLLQALLHNRNRQQERIRLFESGLRFVTEEGELLQEPVLGGAVAGSRHREQWGEANRPVDFFDVKADVEAVLEVVDTALAFRFEKARHPALHPGQSARILRGDEPIGWLGMLHPRLERSLDTGGHVYLFELGLRALDDGRLPAFEPLSRFPSIRRDLAVVVDEAVTAEAIRSVVVGAAPEVLTELRIFDVYQGDRIESGRKSLALGLILQDSCRTLKDVEVDGVIDSVVGRLQQKLDATLRE
jgi:phenylalanyl-tRNA synthetase beta chain